MHRPTATYLIIAALLVSAPCHGTATTETARQEIAEDGARIFSGKVLDSAGSTLQGANVVAFDKEGRTLSYSITDSSGGYSIRVAPGTAYITVSFIGMKSVTIPMESLTQGQTVTLQDESFKLRTVTVQAERIRESGDTLSYSVAGFKQAQDRSVAEVIQRMPGLEVKPNGAIEYQGKEISKFYIEGLDLTGGQYSLASNNISADKVKDVQVLENHQEVKSLRGVRFEERAALNIVLKDEAKAVWTAIADAGFGYGEELLYDNRVMAMQFAKRFQTLMLYKNDNTGADIGSELEDLSSYGSYSEEPGVLQMMSVPSPGFDREKYTFNASHLVAGNWLWKTGKDSELRFQMDGFMDREEMRSFSSTSYLDVDGAPQVDESWNLSGRRKEIGGNVNYTLNTDRTYIRSRTAFSGKWNSSEGLWTLGDQGAEMMVSPHSRMVSEDFSLSHTTSRGNVWQVESSTGNTFLPGSLLTAEGTVQDLPVNLFSSRNALTFSIRSGKNHITGKAGIDYGSQDIRGMRLNSATPYYQQAFQFTFSDHSLTVSCKLGYLHQRYGTEAGRDLVADTGQRGDIVVDPELNWRWKPDGKNTLTVRYSLATSALSGAEVISEPIFTSYRNKYIGTGNPGVKLAHSVILSYSYRNPLNGLFFNLRPFFIHSSGNLLYESGLDDNVYFMKATGQTYSSDLLSGSFRLEESFSAIRLNMGIGGSASCTSYSSLIAGAISRYTLDVFRASADFSYRASSWLTAEGKSGMSASRRRCITTPALSTGYIRDWSHSLKVNVFPLKGLRFSADCNTYHSSEKDYGVNWFCDLSAGYRKGKWEFDLMLDNVAGTAEYQRMRVTSTLRTYSITYLRPRSLLLKFSVEF